jgi:hypothetical protein
MATNMETVELSCEESRSIFARIVSGDPSTTECEEDAFTAHVSRCVECRCAFFLAEGFNGDGSFPPDEEAFWADVTATRTIVEDPTEYISRRCSDLAKAYRKAVHQRKRRQVFRWFGQVLKLCVGYRESGQ